MRLLLPNTLTLVAAVLLLPGLLAAGPLRLDAGEPVLVSGGSMGQDETVSATSGSRPRALYLEKIIVTGNRRFTDVEILDAVQLFPRDVINVEMLERERVRLLAAYPGLFDVRLFTRPGSSRGQVIVEIEIVERKTFSLETGYGYHDLNGWFLTLIGLRFEDLFHTDTQLRLGFRYGFNLVRVDAEWERPAPRDGGLGWNVRLYVLSEDRRFFGSGAPEDPAAGDTAGYAWDGSGWNEFRQKIERSGGEVSALYRLGDTHFSFGARAQSVRPDSTFQDVERDSEREIEDLPDVLQGDADKTVITGLFFRMTRDTRDHVVYPRSGSFALLSLEANNTILGGDEIFTRTVLDLRKLAHLGGDRVLSGRLNAGITTSGTPYYERFTLGGIYSIRGFRELSLSPTAGDDGFWMASCELRFPLIGSLEAPPRLSGLVFVDAGQGWQRGSAFSTADIESAAGYGVRLRLPWLGMLGLDAGIPFSPGRTGDNFRIHGSLGFSF
ncbi:MAG: BamA/TamA family outer membrane protein [Candidatus Eisenbacteria bacterium]